MLDLHIALRLARRAHFRTFAVYLCVVLVVAVLLAAQFSGRQAATLGMDVGLSVIRLALPILGALLLQELLSREFERKLYLTSLTYPRPRHHFLLGRVGGVGLLLLILLAVLAALLAAIVAAIEYSQPQVSPPALGLQYAVTIIFVAVDLSVVLAIGTLVGVLASTPSFVLIGTLGFMLVARSFSSIVALLTRDTTLVGYSEAYQSSLSLLGYVLPDLASLDVRMIALYGQWAFLPADWGIRILSALAYICTSLGLAVWAFNRKRFA